MVFNTANQKEGKENQKKPNRSESRGVLVNCIPIKTTVTVVAWVVLVDWQSINIGSRLSRWKPLKLSNVGLAHFFSLVPRMDLRAPNMTRAERFGNRSMSLYSAERMYLRTVFELAIRTLSLTALKESKPKAVCYVLSSTFNEFSIFSADKTRPECLNLPGLLSISDAYGDYPMKRMLVSDPSHPPIFSYTRIT